LHGASPDEQKPAFDRLLARAMARRQSAYNRIKRHAKRPSRKHLDLLLDKIAWIDELGNSTRPILSMGIAWSR
jgi:hypothetical protein